MRDWLTMFLKNVCSQLDNPLIKASERSADFQNSFDAKIRNVLSGFLTICNCCVIFVITSQGINECAYVSKKFSCFIPSFFFAKKDANRVHDLHNNRRRFKYSFKLN